MRFVYDVRDDTVLEVIPLVLFLEARPQGVVAGTGCEHALSFLHRGPVGIFTEFGHGYSDDFAAEAEEG